MLLKRRAITYKIESYSKDNFKPIKLLIEKGKGVKIYVSEGSLLLPFEIGSSLQWSMLMRSRAYNGRFSLVSCRGGK